MNNIDGGTGSSPHKAIRCRGRSQEDGAPWEKVPRCLQTMERAHAPQPRSGVDFRVFGAKTCFTNGQTVGEISALVAVYIRQFDCPRTPLYRPICKEHKVFLATGMYVCLTISWVGCNKILSTSLILISLMSVQFSQMQKLRWHSEVNYAYNLTCVIQQNVKH